MIFIVAFVLTFVAVSWLQWTRAHKRSPKP